MTIPFCWVRSFCNAPHLKNQILYLCHYLVFEKFLYVCGGYGIEVVVKGNAYALLAFAHAESTAECNLVCNVIFVDQTLKLFYNLARTLDMAGAADTYC